jgi:hypothetical protein
MYQLQTSPKKIMGFEEQHGEHHLSIEGFVIVFRPNCLDATDNFVRRPIFGMSNTTLVQSRFTADVEVLHWLMWWIESLPMEIFKINLKTFFALLFLMVLLSLSVFIIVYCCYNSLHSSGKAFH